ncbi:MAG: DUF4157 domain-containing protein [Stenomitos frigidus ULC029]
MQTHDTQASKLQPKTGTPKAHPLAPRSFEATDPGQAHAASPTNPFARRTHEVPMGERVSRSPVASPEAKTEPDSPLAEQAGYLPFSLHAPGQPPPPLPWWHHTQAKLTIGQPNDPFEQEADAVAEQVMTMPDPDARVQRQANVEAEAEETGEAEEDVQPKWLGDVSLSVVQRQPEGATTDTGTRRQPFNLQAPDRPSPPAIPWWGIQTKLTIGQPNDVYEQEADRVAEQVMSMPDSATQQPIQRETAPEDDELQTKPLATSITPLVQREAMPEEEEIQTKLLANPLQRQEMPEEEEAVQTKSFLQRATDGSLQAGGNLESRLNSSQGGGSPLPQDVKGFMESRFRTDFSQVRVHTDNEAVQMNRDLNAQAFTHKQDVYFGGGKAPGKDALTAHELTHVVQQTDEVQAEQASASIQRLSKLSSSPQIIQRSEVCDEEGVCQSIPEPEPLSSQQSETSDSNVITLPEIVVEGNPTNPDLEPVAAVDSNGAGGAPGSVDRESREGGTEGSSNAEQSSQIPVEDNSKSIFGHMGDFGTGFYEGGKDAVTGVASMAEGAWDLTGGWLTNPEESKATWSKLKTTTQTVAENPGVVWEAIKAPYVEAWNNGRPGEAMGRGTFEAVSLLAGTKGLDKLAKGSKLGKVANVADKVGDAGKVADKVSDAGKVAEETGNAAHNAAEFEKFKARLAAEELEGAPAKGSALKPDSEHRAASWVTDTVAEEGKHFSIKGGDGKTKNLTQLEGNMNGQDGVFEYIVDEKGDLTHQRFIPKGRPNGIANQNPKKLDKWDYKKDVDE